MIEMMLGGGKIPVPKGRIQKFEAGGAGIAALTTSGNLYSIGDQYYSGAGGTTNSWNLLASGIVDFWGSFRSILARTRDGRWLFMGNNFYFPTALGSTVPTFVDVSEYMAFPEGLEIKEVSLGYASIAVIFTDGQYAMTGRNNQGGLGQGNTTAVRQLTMRTDFTDVKKITFDWTSLDTSYMLLENGQIYAAGSSDFGQVGIISGISTTWRLQPAVTGVIDIVGGPAGWFRVVDTGSMYLFYAQGRHFDGSLGTGSTTAMNYSNPVAVGQNISDRSKGPPPLYVGLYSARYEHPDGSLYYTGTSSGQLQGTGIAAQPVRYSFTKLDPIVLQGHYTALRSSYKAAYILLEGNLYGTGQDASAATGLLPGFGTTRILTFELLDTSPLV